MTQLELASRAAAGAMGYNPVTEWERARPIAEAVLAAIAGTEAEGEIVEPEALSGIKEDNQRYREIYGVDDPDLAHRLADLIEDRTTSPEVASIAARLMHHEDPDVRAVAASALVQR